MNQDDIDRFDRDLMAEIAPGVGQRTQFVSQCNTDCENVDKIPIKFLHAHGIEVPVGLECGRFCTAYGDLCCYVKAADGTVLDSVFDFNKDCWCWL